VPIYASTTPKVGDFPFSYFYLLIYMPAVAIACWIVVLLQKRLRPALRRALAANVPDLVNVVTDPRSPAPVHHRPLACLSR
jgi:hypothetical protein